MYCSSPALLVLRFAESVFSIRYGEKYVGPWKWFEKHCNRVLAAFHRPRRCVPCAKRGWSKRVRRRRRSRCSGGGGGGSSCKRTENRPYNTGTYMHGRACAHPTRTDARPERRSPRRVRPSRSRSSRSGRFFGGRPTVAKSRIVRPRS